MTRVQELRARFYLATRTNGFVADLGYSTARHVQQFQRSLKYKWHQLFSHKFVAADKALKYRQLDISGMLATGVTNVCNAKCTFCAYPKVVAAKTLQTGVMPFEVFKKAVDEWAAAGGQG